MTTASPSMRRLLRAHRRVGIFRTGTSVVLWLATLGAFLAGVITTEHLSGVTAAAVFLIAMSPANLWVLNRCTRARTLTAWSIAIHAQEVVGYTAVMHFLGGIEASFLSAMYCVLIASVGLMPVRGLPYILATLSSVAF